MDCNREEAVRAKEIAEGKLLERDIDGAKKFALKAKNLFQELDGLSQFLEIVNVHVAHEKKINGVADYYGILGVDPTANEEAVKKQYRRMALSLHPDKNKSVGADGAFKMMSEAWSVLSDQNKRSAYDLIVDIRSSNRSAGCSTSSANYTSPAAYPMYVPTQPSNVGTATSQPWSSSSHHQWNTASGTQDIRTPQNPSSGTSRMNAPDSQQTFPVPPCPMNTIPVFEYPSLHKFRRSPVPIFSAQYIPTLRPPFYNQNIPSRNQTASSTCLPTRETFWTLCNKCDTHYEYKKIYLNQTLLCGHCKKPFFATAMPPPPLHNQRHQETPTPAPAPSSRTSQHKFSQPSKKPSKRRHEEGINIGRENHPPVKSNCSVLKDVENASASSYTAPDGVIREKPVKRRREDGQKYVGSREGGQGTAGSGVNNKKADVKGDFRAEQSRSVKESSHSNIRIMLTQKAKREIHCQLNEWEKQKLNASLNRNVQDKGNIVHVFGNNSSSHLKTKNQQTLQPQDSSSNLKETCVDPIPDDIVLMSVPDANFHNFDEDRIEKSFSQDQVWAAYDDDDGMPRYYAMVHQVISRSPFKMQISWLNSKSSSEFGSLEWIASGFTKTTGNFRAGKHLVSESLNSFSHPVKWEKGSKGVIQILPTKGDVWTLYKNWSSDWDETTEDETVHEYDLVVVLQDYNEDTGVSVAPLFKVAGFTSVFNQIPDRRRIQTIPREEMFRFSHQVPFYLLNGLEAENAPKNCYELDPAALPLELLNVISEAEAAERIVAYSEILRGPGPENKTMVEGCSSKTQEDQRSSVKDPKYAFTYCRRNKRKKSEGDAS